MFIEMNYLDGFLRIAAGNMCVCVCVCVSERILYCLVQNHHWHHILKNEEYLKTDTHIMFPS